jgi:hypothetical protein
VHTVTFSSVFMLKRMQTLSIYDRSCSLFNILEIYFPLDRVNSVSKRLKGKKGFENAGKRRPCEHNLSIYSVIKSKSRCFQLFIFLKNSSDFQNPNSNLLTCAIAIFLLSDWIKACAHVIIPRCNWTKYYKHINHVIMFSCF